jgi:dihydroceramide fatty acyl 2-hydroxylase
MSRAPYAVSLTDLTRAAALCTLIAMAADPNTRRSDWLRASPPMFDRAWMDRFTRIHPAVVPLIFVPTILIMGYIGATNTSTWRFFAYLVVGYVLWTLTEYWLHRVVFHFEPEDGLGAKLHWLIHGVHHEHPNDPNRLVMPPSASIPLAAIFLVLYRVLFGAPAWLAVSAGFLVGYVVYDTMHWYLHHRIPRSRMGRRLRELHLRHHFQDDTRGFGISAPYWDRVFRTAPASRRKAGRRDEG